MNYYARAIEIMHNLSSSQEVAMLLEIAKHNPGAIVKAHAALSTPPDQRPRANGRSELDEELIALTKCGNKVAAIKLRRERTGEGLKEAKDYVDDLMAKA